MELEASFSPYMQTDIPHIEWPEKHDPELEQKTTLATIKCIKERLALGKLDNEQIYLVVLDPPTQINTIEEEIFQPGRKFFSVDLSAKEHLINWGEKGVAILIPNGMVFKSLLPNIFKLGRDAMAIIIIKNPEFEAIKKISFEIVISKLMNREDINIEGLVYIGLLFDWGELIEIF